SFEVAAHAGLNRAAWDLRYDAPNVVALRTTPADNPHIWEEPRFRGQDTRPVTHWGIEGAQRAGPLAAPGAFSVSVNLDGQDVSQPFKILKDPAIAASDADLEASTQMQVRVRDDMNQAVAMINRLELLRKQSQDPAEEKKLLDVELQLLSRSSMQSDDKYYPEQYKVYMNLIWFNGEIGTGAGDVAGGADHRPTTSPTPSSTASKSSSLPPRPPTTKSPPISR